jgi:reactive chlorine resistance protein C
LAVLLFLATLSFLCSTPGIDAPIRSMTGQLLIKDLVLLGASVWTLGEVLIAARRRTA